MITLKSSVLTTGNIAGLVHAQECDGIFESINYEKSNETEMEKNEYRKCVPAIQKIGGG